MCGYTRTGLKFRRSQLSALSFDPKRTHTRTRFILQRAGEVDDCTAGVACTLPGFTCAILVRSKKSEVDVLKLLGAHALDKADLVAHGLKLSESLVVVEQADIDRREIPFVQHLGNLFAFERGCADDSGTVEIRSSDPMRGRCWPHGLVH